MSIPFAKENRHRVLKAIEGDISYERLSPAEWRQFVQNYNYDDGIEPFEWLIKQKICDKGTALCLYWHLDPFYYYEESFKDIDNPNYKLIREIEDRFAAGFYENEEFAFDPYDNDPNAKCEFMPKNADTSIIPDIMLQKTNGVPFGRVDLEFAFLRAPNEKESETIDKKINNAIAILRQIDAAYLYNDTDKTVEAIANAVAHFAGKELGAIEINDLSFLWLDCVAKKHGWSWVMWDYETGATYGVSNRSKSLTCLANTIITHTIDGFQKPQIITKLYWELSDENAIDNIYSGIGLLFYTSHLEFIGARAD
ncbi:MAG: DUF4274 domain-containing protein [Helicobacteraceae bacterium]|jgi:hypothetical protein|nr:DUF4274 domain-containing protein [Helicobacteraceae bacterium]